MAITVKDWKLINKGNAIGVCTVETTAMRFREVMIIRRQDGGCFASLPSKPMIDRDGKQMTDDNGKRRYTTIIEWKSRDTASQFSDDVVAALRNQGVDL